MNRREFILSGLAASVVAGCRTVDLFGAPNLVFGVVSDIHVMTPETTARFEKALRYFRRRGVDAVLVSGDLTDWGLAESLTFVRGTWLRVFGGTDVVPLFCTGNHDFEGWQYGDMTMEMHANGYSEKDAIVRAAGGMKAVWQNVLGEPYAPVRVRSVKGYDFVSAEYLAEDGKSRPDVGAFMKAHADRFRGTRPFFYFQHLPISNTTGDSSEKEDGPGAFQALSQFPNAVSFTGHTHQPFFDERQIWQGAFTAIGVPSLSYPSLPGCENGSAARNGSATNAMRMMPVRRDLEGTQGYVVSVYDDRIVVERRDLEADGEEAAPAWIVPVGGAKPFEAKAAEARVPAPAFPEGAGVKAYTRNTENRQGKWTIVMVCEFPSAIVPPGWRVYDYEIRAVPTDGSKPLVKRFVSPAFHRLASCEPRRQKFWFDVAELPQDRDYKLEVRARNCFGAASSPLVSGILHSQPGLGVPSV